MACIRSITRSSPRNFVNFWKVAGKTLHHQADNHMWLRAHLYHPYIDHLEFRLGNQNFSVLLDFSGTDRAHKYPIDAERQDLRS